MTRAEFEAALDTLGISQSTFAALTGVDRQTVYRWGKDRSLGQDKRAFQPVPSWVPVMLRTWKAAPRVLATLIKELEAALQWA